MKKNLLTCLAAAALSLAAQTAVAADYYVVVPVPGGTSAKVANISVALNVAQLPVGLVGLAYPGFDLKSALVVTGDSAYTSGLVQWSVVSGAIPAGLALNADGTLSGTPTAAGSGSFAVKATYKTKSGQQTYQVVVSQLTVTLADVTLPVGVVGSAYNNGAGFDFKTLLSVPADPGFNASLATFALTSGNMPDGMALSSAGKLTGTPTAVSAGTALQVSSTYKTNTGTHSYNWVASTTADPFWANVLVSMPMTGAANSTVFPDLKGHTTGLLGAAKISTADSKFGGSSLQTSGSYGNGVNISGADLDLSAGNYAVEGWVKFNSVTSGDYQNLLTSGNNTFPSRWVMDLGVSATTITPRIVTQSNTIYWAGAAAPYTLGTWAHIAYVSNATTNKFTVFVNGVNTGYRAAIPLTTFGGAFQVGRNSSASSNAAYNIDEFRITNGTPRYTGDFTVPTDAFPTK